MVMEVMSVTYWRDGGACTVQTLLVHHELYSVDGVYWTQRHPVRTTLLLVSVMALNGPCFIHLIYRCAVYTMLHSIVS